MTMPRYAAITLPYPPTVNNYYTVARGRKILSKKGRAYKMEALGWLMEQNAPKGREGAYSVSIYVMPPDKRRRDIDNLIKPLLDSLVEYGVIPDDSMIFDLRIQRFDSVKGGKVEMTVCRE